jgi:hypothetical protein
MTPTELLDLYRRILDSIHALGSIFYDTGRYEAYKIVALLASDLRKAAEAADYYVGHTYPRKDM